MSKENETILPNVKMSSNYLLGLYHMAKHHDLDTYDNLFEKDVSAADKYHDLSISEYYNLFNKKGHPNLVNELEQLSEHVNHSNGSRIYKKLDLNIGIICDEFLYQSYKDVVNLKYVGRQWEEKDHEYDFVIIASTWKGIDGSWQGISKEKTEERYQLYELIRYLRDRNIPTLFYSKEDPVNYDVFIGIAKECDYVFTSAEEMIPKYKEAVGHKNVHKLEFGINPHYHNPIGTDHPAFKKFRDEVIFAGSWMVKYPIRNKETAMAFEGVKKAGRDLKIFDRNLKLENKRYHFPPKYIENLSYPLTHELLMKTHKMFKYAINVNSVKYSNTMFANRVYELQAFGNILLSNFSIGVNSKFPNVFIFNHKTDLPHFLNHTDDKTLREISAAGIRQTMNYETTYHRIQYLNQILGKGSVMDEISVLVIVNEDSEMAREMFNHQSYRNKKLIPRDNIDEVDLNSYRFIAYFDTTKYYYEEYYLEELVSGFKYADVDYVSKNGEDEKYNFTSNYPGLDRSMVDGAKIQSSGEQINNILNVVPGNFNGLNIDDTEIVSIKGTNTVKASNEFKMSIVIPIHNNGRYLESKCFRSLQRSSVFEHMEIVFVNDGSTDQETIDIINRLRRRNPDILYYEFENPSGSASTPRNKGVEIATTEYISFLDPDNEATGDGYASLLNTIEADDSLDMVVGNMVKEDQNERSIFDYYKVVKLYNYKKDIIEDAKGFLKRSFLKAQSIQALVVRKDIIIDNNIKMVEGAIGQDTIYYQELLINSSKVKAIDEVVHMYYGAVADSVTNVISISFFEKYMKLERYRIDFLKSNDLLDEYIENRFEYYMLNWYLPRLKRMQGENRSAAAEKLMDIYKLYEPYLGTDYELIETQIKQYL
ncbi:glycosyltransferase [Salinicoccus cyprini]|uniref:Glycosyltransferase n=1 Tax=Salinicoccus cyprini TaxID=2493691 RepID=A0A558AX94_9STAP|nr:glycosyltransferase [Salinicoccus cyprini]TVT28877.1 glycosyltransferase [Salinicoccus cyprini]